MPDDSQASEASPLTFSKSSTATVGGGGTRRIPDGRGGSGGGGDDRLDRRDEPVAAPRDGLDVLRAGGIVAERLAQLGNRLRQRVVGHRDVRPQRPEQLVFRDQHRRPRGEEQQQVDDLRRERDVGAVAQQPVGAAVDDEGPELVGRGGLASAESRTRGNVPRATWHRVSDCVTISASLTFRGPAASDGLLTIFPSTHIVVEPPPSRFSALLSPSRRASARSSESDMPALSLG